jgi:superfamily I DNA/RNA helicase
MHYLALAEKTATWLLGKTELLLELARTVRSAEIRALGHGDFVLIPVRVAAERDVVIFSNAEFRSALNDEHIGFIEIAGADLVGDGVFADEAFRRAVLIISRRLRGLVFDADYQYRRPDTRRSSMLAAKNSAVQLNWVERTIQIGATGSKTLLVTVPSKDLLSAAAGQELYRDLRGLMQLTRSLVTARGRPKLGETALPKLREAVQRNTVTTARPQKFSAIALARRPEVSAEDIRRAESWTYDRWCGAGTTLSSEQHAILDGDAILQHPVRLFGPAGSGKTLLMQLMTVRRLRADHVSVLYATHNVAMEEFVKRRFAVLEDGRDSDRASLKVTTLSGFAKDLLGLRITHELENDPEHAKAAAFNFLQTAIKESLEENRDLIARNASLHELTATEAGRRYFDEYVRAEISSVIKGRGAVLERQDYTNSGTPLGRLHAVLNPRERGVVYDAFERYQEFLQKYGVMDPDDVAVSLLLQLRTPKWKIDRTSLGFDFVFVDEAQLFNDNERLIFALLTNGRHSHTPVAIALDEAQRLYDPASGGPGLYGLLDVKRETLHLGHRLSEDIARLAFFIIAESSTLYDDDFPDFPGVTLDFGERLGGEQKPQLFTVRPEHLAKQITRIVKRLRFEGLMQFAVIAHSVSVMERLRADLETLMEKESIEFSILRERGDQRDVAKVSVVLSRPELIGGQEFDCVLCCGLEEGAVPPKVRNNPTLEMTLEQQAMREIYLAFTRARHQLFVINADGTRPSPILQRAVALGYIEIAKPPEED